MDSKKETRRHIYLGATGKAESYTSMATVRKPPIPAQNRPQHGGALQEQLTTVAREQDRLVQEAATRNLESAIGIQVEFESYPGVDLAVASLANAASHIELLNVRKDEDRVYATVFVPEGKLSVFEDKLQAYLERKQDKNGKPRDNQALIDAIASFRAGALESLWTDTREQFPQDEDESFWWELWLPTREDRQAVIRDFKKLAAGLRIEVGEQVLEFPERSVLLAKGTRGQFAQSSLMLNCVAEARRAKETAAFFDELDPAEQAAWSDDLLTRLRLHQEDCPYVCILDTGVNIGNPLLQPFLAYDDQYAIDAEWTGTDDDGHGTGMAGLAVWGDLAEPLAGTDLIAVGHRLESVKLLRHDADNDGKQYGLLTADAMTQPEIEHPERTRVYTMALTTRDGRDGGKPSAWSGAVDALAADALGEGASPRLMTLAAGNIAHSDLTAEGYTDLNQVNEVHDPGQAWNALTVGAYTDKADIQESDYDKTLAQGGGLSPWSTTSMVWNNTAPLKPEIVFEGGNAGLNQHGCFTVPSLSLLTTYHQPITRVFTTFEATSAASALAGRFAARIWEQYPDLWPETVRALTVHSADWTEEMLRQFSTGSTTRKQAQHRVRCVGYGVPDIDRAVWSASNSLALIVEDRLQPFEKTTQGIKTRDMHLHELPWPSASLESLGNEDVELVVTLSYFIEPNPSSRNVPGKYSYASHQLRFDVKRPLESIDEFRKRINREAGAAETGSTTGPGDSNWLLGPQFRHKGSIHKDVWSGKAVDLAERGQIAVYPAMGWWRTRAGLRCYDRTARYSLVVSIRVPKVDVDIYNDVATQIQVAQTV